MPISVLERIREMGQLLVLRPCLVGISICTICRYINKPLDAIARTLEPFRLHKGGMLA